MSKEKIKIELEYRYNSHDWQWFMLKKWHQVDDEIKDGEYSEYQEFLTNNSIMQPSWRFLSHSTRQFYSICPQVREFSKVLMRVLWTEKLKNKNRSVFSLACEEWLDTCLFYTVWPFLFDLFK